MPNANNTTTEDIETDSVEAVVIGAGVVGLAVARQLASDGREVVILESEDHPGSGISARNSEVIHAGIYYPADSLKARHCVRGRELLYEYCEQHQVRADKCGKLIVATSSEQLETLSEIKLKAEANGVDDLRFLDSSEVASLEPALSTFGALLSPSTGIVDSHGFMLSMLGEAESHGAMLALGATVTGITGRHDHTELVVDGEQPMRLRSKVVVNASGHGAVSLATQAGVNRECADGRPSSVPKAVLAKGSYFLLNQPSPVSRLVYPVPVSGGLGVHITLDMAGRARFGPDVEWVDDFDYQVDPSRAESFYEAIRRYWPALPDSALAADYAGIRPKIAFDDAIYPDFVIEGPETTQLPGLVNLLGIESPGLTSSLAIAEHVATLV